MIEMIGGPDRDRTDDLFHAMEARSQLRHRPTCCSSATSLLSPLRRIPSNFGVGRRQRLLKWHEARAIDGTGACACGKMQKQDYLRSWIK